MEFNQKELEHLLNCLNFYYAESDYKAHIMEVNSTLCKKIDEQKQIEIAQKRLDDLCQ